MLAQCKFLMSPSSLPFFFCSVLFLFLLMILFVLELACSVFLSIYLKGREGERENASSLS